jgi:hypothetical protein
VQHDRTARSETVACPICGRPLKWRADRWLAVFECARCGEFSDFDGASISPAEAPAPINRLTVQHHAELPLRDGPKRAD